MKTVDDSRFIEVCLHHENIIRKGKSTAAVANRNTVRAGILQRSQFYFTHAFLDEIQTKYCNFDGL